MKNTTAERILDFLKDFPPFNLIPKKTLLEIAKNVEIHYFEKDQIILLGFSFFGDPFSISGEWTEDNEIGRLILDCELPLLVAAANT